MFKSTCLFFVHICYNNDCKHSLFDSDTRKNFWQVKKVLYWVYVWLFMCESYFIKLLTLVMSAVKLCLKNGQIYERSLFERIFSNKCSLTVTKHSLKLTKHSLLQFGHIHWRNS